MKKTLLFIAVATVSTTSYARNDLSVSVSTTMAGYTYEDSDGESDSATFVIPITIGAEYELDRVNKLYASWRVIDEDIDATKSGDMGVTLEGSQLEASWLHKVRLARHFKPYVGFGIRTSFIEASSKHTVDDEGFLLETFESTEDTNLSAVFSVYSDWEISRDGWYIDTRFTYDIPFGDGLQGYAVSAGIKHEF